MSTKPPKTLGLAGKDLWKWASKAYEITGTEPLLSQLCELADRLAGVRTELSARTDPKLITAEVQLVGQFARVWKLLGLAESPEPKKAIGYPQGQPRRRPS